MLSIRYFIFRVDMCRYWRSSLPLINSFWVTQRFADLIRQYGLRKIRFHDLRHTFASILINQDVPLLNVSTFLGHSDLSTTANIYAHLDKSKKQESADVISSIFNKAKE